MAKRRSNLKRSDRKRSKKRDYLSEEFEKSDKEENDIWFGEQDRRKKEERGTYF